MEVNFNIDDPGQAFDAFELYDHLKKPSYLTSLED